MRFSFLAASLLPTAVIADTVVALGSSYAYGEGIGGSDSRDRNNPNNGTYGARFANYINATFQNLAASGSQLKDIYSGPTFLNGITNDTRYVVITAGGNDLGWIGCVQRTSNSSLGVAGCSRPANQTTTTSRYVTAVQKVYEKLNNVSVPNANNTPVYMVTYIHLFGSGYTINSTTEVPQNSSVVQDLHNQFYEPLRVASVNAYNTLKNQSYNVRLIAMVSNSVKNAIDASAANGGPWSNGNSNITLSGAAWHPNTEGYHQIARFIYKDLKGSFPVETAPVQSSARSRYSKH